jgi:hypothetical protein
LDCGRESRGKGRGEREGEREREGEGGGRGKKAAIISVLEGAEIEHIYIYIHLLFNAGWGICTICSGRGGGGIRGQKAGINKAHPRGGIQTLVDVSFLSGVDCWERGEGAEVRVGMVNKTREGKEEKNAGGVEKNEKTRDGIQGRANLMFTVS